jgi:poly-beta-1,6-N-acetyl-D-glucosamine biosynthesis protein PgaD
VGIRLLEAVATGVVWLAYFGILPYIWLALTQRGAPALAVPVAFQWGGADGLGFESFVLRLLAVVLVGSASLYLWATYNSLRFRGKDRRKAPVCVTPTDLAAYYGGTPAQIVTLQDARRLYMRHDADGRLTRIHYGEAPDPEHSAIHAPRRVRAKSGQVHTVSGTPTQFDAMSTQELRRYTREA